MNTIYAGLFLILALVLTLPFLVKKIEEELELFLFLMGCVALTLTKQWSGTLVEEALVEPVKITAAVLIAGFLFRSIQKPLTENIGRMVRATGIRSFVFLLIVALGFLSSAATAIVTSIILVEIINCLKLDRKTEIRIVVLTCFSIGLGAALTPIGEPLSTIVIAKLKGEPYHADFFFLFRHLKGYVLIGIASFGLLGMMFTSPGPQGAPRLSEGRNESAKDILLRTGKVYLFVMALVFLGTGFKPIIDAFILKISYRGLYWINTVSAVLDNATLAAAEMSPNMSILQIKAALLGLLISGGMLIPGNIPNIISAGKLKIKSSEWARFGVPLGLAFMCVYFFLLR
jgi:predicted cation transporter